MTQTKELITRVKSLIKEAQDNTNLKYPNAFNLATVSKDGMPNNRILLVKGWTDESIKFYSNKSSQKGQEIEHNSKIALCFYWQELCKQVRIRAVCKELSPEDATAYFNTRPKESRIGAIASNQSHELERKGILEAKIAELYEKYKDTDNVPRPSDWIGYEAIPLEVEFWTEGDFRIHTRELYIREDIESDNWKVKKLYP